MRHAHKVFVISAINFTEGGGYEALKDFIETLIKTLDNNWRIVALVHNKALFKRNKKINYIDNFFMSKNSRCVRLFYEWVYFKYLSIKLNADVWFSFHDITPNVTAKRQAVYCHNVLPFYSLNFCEFFFEPALLLFTKFYGLIYRIGIHKNSHIIVQQDWIKKIFQKSYNCRNIIIAHPVNQPFKINRNLAHLPNSKKITSFIYPAFPRSFKNFEVICSAAEKLNRDGLKNFQIFLTIDGSENRYAKYIVSRYGFIPQLKFIGLQNRQDLIKLYKDANCLIFPSKLESWGLPISEAKFFNLPILVANMPYAKESVGNYSSVNFFAWNNCNQLSKLMKNVVNKKNTFKGNKFSNHKEGFAENWTQLIKMLIKDI
jgi:glycosyltransferase involved in cell wall biosynthesis